jgi:L-alanine-DL-glutamate epimerase-like enolase superfamily enzyme
LSIRARFEEPLNRADDDGYAHLRRRAGVSIAIGEREFDTVTLRELIRRDAIDLSNRICRASAASR